MVVNNFFKSCDLEHRRLLYVIKNKFRSNMFSVWNPYKLKFPSTAYCCLKATKLKYLSGSAKLFFFLHIVFKGSLHTAIFSKYTELLQLKNILRIFWDYFWNILEINVFQNKSQSLCKKRGNFLKIAYIDNNKLMELLTIAGGSLLLSQEHIKEKRKQRKIFG